MVAIYDHEGDPVTHGRASVNGVRLHYVMAGSGEPLLLLHGTPKTHTYWHKLVPLLTEEFRIVAPDLRGFGDSDRPVAEQGYDVRTNATDMAELMDILGHDTFHVHGEDRGAEFAYGLAALHPDRVETLSFAEMLLSGHGLEEWSNLTRENVDSEFPWLWHISFFWLNDYPELLIRGNERAFWTRWMKDETYDPTAISDEAIDEWVRQVSGPGGLRGVLETYRATLKNAEINATLAEDELDLPVMTIGSREFFGELVEAQMDEVCASVDTAHVFDRCGHSLALESEDELAASLREFMLPDS